MDKGKFLLIHIEALPDVYLKVVEAKNLIKEGKCSSVSEAVKRVNISRSTFYKYNEFVFSLGDGSIGKKATISMNLDHHSGILSKVLECIARNQGNILTISQSTPIDQMANVTITIDISEMTNSFTLLSNDLKSIEGVHKYSLLGIE